MSDLAGRVAIVTGASGVLGETVVRAFLDAGAHVAAAVRSASRAEAVRAAQPESGARLFVDVAAATDETAMSRFALAAVERWGRIDVLAALAGGFASGPVADVPADAVREVFEQNALTAYASIRAVLPHLRARGYGRIVCVGARPALRGAKNVGAYSMAKTAVVRLAESLAEELKDEGITVNVVLPSTIDHPDNRRAMPKADPTRWVSPKEVAAAILFLASPEASGVTGAAIPVFGRV